jgi:hypothetical protein
VKAERDGLHEQELEDGKSFSQCHSAKLKLLHILKFSYVPIFLAIPSLNLGDDHSYERGYGGGWPFFVGLGNYR